MKAHWALIGIMALGVGAGCHNKHEAEEKGEVKMTLAEVPPAVRDTLTKEAGGAPITNVEKEVEHGKTVYETDVTSDGKNWEIKVDESGKLISKKEEKD